MVISLFSLVAAIAWGRELLDRFSSTIEKLYAAAAEPSRWSEALRAVEDLSGSAGAVIGFVPMQPAGEPGFVLSGRFSPEQCAEYARDYAPICPRIAMAVRRPDIDIQYDSLLMGEAELDRDPTYRWFEKNSGVRYYIGAALSSVGGYRVDTSLQRTRAQGHAQTSDIELFSRLRPHLDQALRLSNVIGTLSAERRIGLQALEALPHGVVAIDAAQHILFANPIADRLLAAQDGLTQVNGALAAMRPAEARALARLLGQAASNSGARGGWLRVARPSGRRDYMLFAAPLVVEEVLPGTRRPKAMVAIFDPAARGRIDPLVLQEVFGLTRKEAEVATLLANGQELAAIATRLRMSPETARSHLKMIFRKLEVNRQADVIGLLSALGRVTD
jgi:DNA-binding CsgD family transcriptional regulator/PAS domain-containing protein